MAMLEGGRIKCVGPGDATAPWLTNPSTTRRPSALTLTLAHFAYRSASTHLLPRNVGRARGSF
jgi:hypothetical protein